ncbi:DNA polymerase-3 subunit epsilon [Mesonia hippocampi]|uniref:Excinuclease cho n=1 Tax=Mesonia hippocampi TaxID=1628250 RepID=A0A840ERV2_9FLAO|nr:exonuclease domain-containing protein [Mesonia hippocampi]MBB4119700.1 DNA polymerase-3 subunit epsilon [Mesonia hippocampi]
MYAIVDIETTGGKYNEEGITEIAIYKHNGHEVTDQLISLVNPERKIQAFVVKLTGINENMLRNAPKFYQIAKRIIEITEGCVIVAHNAKFDYRILQLEFKRLGFDYTRQSVCTVELSKKLIPDMPSYSLGKLVKQLGIPLNNRHRASGDALATVKLFELLLQKDTQQESFKKFLRNKPKLQVENKLIKLLEELPTQTGVYYLYNEQGDILYIGKSKNIKKRINQHFTSSSKKTKQLQKEVSYITYELTGNELLALLKENQAIKKNQPPYNSALKRSLFSHGLFSHTDKNGYLRLYIEKITHQNPNPITSFTSATQAKNTLYKIIEEYQLCENLIGLQKTSSACFSYTIKKCAGACIKKEEPKKYNDRVKQLLIKYNFENKSFAIIDKGRKTSEKSFVYIENGIFKGIGYFNLNHQLKPAIIKNALSAMAHSKDTQHIIQYYLRKSKSYKIINFN